MSKHPLSPEMLMNGIVFGEGSGGGGSSNIKDVSEKMDIFNGERSQNNTKILGYFNTVLNTGLFYVTFKSESTDCSLNIDDSTALFGDIIQCSCSYTKQNSNRQLLFSNFTSGDTITVFGFFTTGQIK